MKTVIIACAAGLLPASLFAQTIVDDSTFFNPDFKVRRTGATGGVLSVSVNTAPVDETMANASASWTHSAGGFAQARTEVMVPFTSILAAEVDAQLAAYTETSGNQLTFGRELSATATLAGVPVSGQDGELTSLLNQVTGAGVLYSWESDATMSGLTIAADQLYKVDFTVTSGAGLPVDLLDASTFGITSAGVTGASNESAQNLGLLGLITLGSSSDTGQFSFTFKSSSARTSLDFNFAASTLAGVTALGGTANNQNVLTFSGLEISQVPEPTSLLMLSVSAGFICFVRKRRKTA